MSISERLDHLAALLSDSELLPVILKDEDKRRNIIRNFRIIKSAEKVRVANELRYLKQMERLNYTLSKPEIMYSPIPRRACESMLANCINQYLNSDY